MSKKKPTFCSHVGQNQKGLSFVFIYMPMKQKHCFFSKMTGSGPTVFGLFRKKVDAKKVYLLLKKKHPKWWSGVFSVKT